MTIKYLMSSWFFSIQFSLNSNSTLLVNSELPFWISRSINTISYFCITTFIRISSMKSTKKSSNSNIFFNRYLYFWSFKFWRIIINISKFYYNSWLSNMIIFIIFISLKQKLMFMYYKIILKIIRKKMVNKKNYKYSNKCDTTDKTDLKKVFLST